MSDPHCKETLSSGRRSLAGSGLALGPLDGRYQSISQPLVDYLSEAALNRDRIHVEVEWFIYLTEKKILPGLQPLTAEQQDRLRALVTDFDAEAIAELSSIEARTVHDVKAVEYYIGSRLEELGLSGLKPLVHFGCTSEDINNLAYALGIKGALEEVWLPAARQLSQQLFSMAQEAAEQPMLARTHGQPATPTTVGKELAVFVHRLNRQLQAIAQTEFLGKFNGATATFSAHTAAAPEVDWLAVSQDFVTGLGLSWNPLTTQIENHDWQAELYSRIAHFNQVLHNLCTDIWHYISIGFFQQVPVAGATGSSTMPHKVNPIRFENAEANLEISNALFNTLSATLVQSRWQRDLTDSSSQRNIGTAFGHSLLAISNVAKGLASLDLACEVIDRDLDQNWEVLAEAIQTVMRAEALAGVPGMEDPYERLKELTRGQRVNAQSLRTFLDGLGLSSSAYQRLSQLTPAGYTGLASQLLTYVQKDRLQD